MPADRHAPGHVARPYVPISCVVSPTRMSGRTGVRIALLGHDVRAEDRPEDEHEDKEESYENGTPRHFRSLYRLRRFLRRDQVVVILLPNILVGFLCGSRPCIDRRKLRRRFRRGCWPLLLRVWPWLLRTQSPHPISTAISASANQHSGRRIDESWTFHRKCWCGRARGVTLLYGTEHSVNPTHVGQRLNTKCALVKRGCTCTRPLSARGRWLRDSGREGPRAPVNTDHVRYGRVLSRHASG